MATKKVVVSTEFNFQQNVKDQITSAALAALTPAKGDRYILTDGANQYKIAFCTVGGVTPTWEYIAVSIGYICFDESESKFYKFLTSWTELSPAETATTIATIINGSTADTPLDADEWGFRDVVDSILKKITWANIKATLKTYFEGIALSLYNGTTATTQSQADNSTKLATTAYVDTGLGTKPTVVDWADYSATSTIVGWTTPVLQIWTKKIGKTVFFRFESDVSAANGSTVTITLPYNANGRHSGSLSATMDNSSFETPGHWIIPAGGGNTVIFYRYNESAWTASGNRLVAGQGFYESA